MARTDPTSALLGALVQTRSDPLGTFSGTDTTCSFSRGHSHLDLDVDTTRSVSLPSHTRQATESHDIPNPYNEAERAESWKTCAEIVEQHSEELLKQWNAELDMLLVFAGLFSAALTAFNVESYSLLQPDSNDIAVLALEHMSAQLHSFSLGQTAINSTIAPFTAPTTPTFEAPLYAVWLNALWFSSLVCTLSASTIAVMVKQWLHQCAQGASGVSREAARLRQHRYESLHKWRLPQIIAVLPILLQVSLVLFLAGLVILLWNLHPTVAICASMLFGMLMLFISITTILPTFTVDCCYLSPQALGLYGCLQAIARGLASVLERISARLDLICNMHRHNSSRRRKYYKRMSRRLLASVHRMRAWASWSSWQVRERATVERKAQYLDRALAATTYAVTLDDYILNAELSRCMWDMDAENVVPFCRDVLGAPRVDHDRRGTALDVFLLNYCILGMGKVDPAQLLGGVDDLMDYPIWFSMQSPDERHPEHHNAYLWGLARMAPRHTPAFLRLCEILKGDGNPDIVTLLRD
ncbi:hypothetical protein C8Q76DRAFT_845387 [Earliella scabrosa]|nr:hypothetical protein C8Q76DRAFT_845387 [Earliella scabrosa]